MKRLERKTIAVDFDGVLHQWSGEWKGYHVIEGAPIPGAIEWLTDTVECFDVVIFTTRGATWRGRCAVRAWLRRYGFKAPGIKVTATKVPAIVYLDDRAMRFDGTNWPSVERLRGAVPWWRAAK